MADNLRKFTTQEVLNKVYTDSSGDTIGLQSQTSKETLNAVLNTSTNSLNVSLSGSNTISGDVTITGDLTVQGGGSQAFDEIVQGTMSITTADNSTQLSLISTDEDANVGPALELYRNSASPANSDLLGTVYFFGEDGAGNKEQYARIESVAGVKGSGSEEGVLNFYTNNAGTLTNNRLAITGSETVINESSGNFDFRVESNNNANMLFVDAGNDRVGIGSSVPESLLHIESAQNATIRIHNTTTGYAPQLLFEGNVGTNADHLLGKIDATWDGASNVVSSVRFESGADTSNKDDGVITFWTSSASSSVTERMRITSAGNVGIGCDHPSVPLEVELSGDTGTYFEGGGSGNDASDLRHLKITASTTTNAGDTHTLNAESSTGVLKFATSGSDRMTINSTGVGIGGTPSTELHIQSSDRTSFRLQGTVTSDGVVSDIQFFNASDSVGAINMNRVSNDDQADMTFHTQPNSGSVTERMRIDSTGNVGIGDSTPDDKLSIYGGDKQIRMGASDSNHVVIGRNSSSGNFEMARTCTDAAEEVFFRATENEAGALTFFTSEVARFIIDANSRISLSNNDAGASGRSYNTIFGYLAGDDLQSTGIYNSFFGDSAGHQVTTGDYNTAFGLFALDGSTVPDRCTAIGTSTLRGNVEAAAQGATAVGFSALNVLTNGANTTAVGFEAGKSITVGDHNTVLGHSALALEVGGQNSVAIGSAALYTQDGGDSETAMDNIGIGRNAGYHNVTGIKNTYIGSFAGQGASGQSNSNNTAIGSKSMLDVTTGSNNVAIGMESAQNLTDGQENVIIGDGAGQTTTSVHDVVVIGRGAMQNGNVTNNADGTVAVGYKSLEALTSGVGNTAVGYLSLDAEDDGDRNTAIGYQALTNQTGTSGIVGNTALGYGAGDSITTGVQNVLLGSTTDPSANSGNNQVVIGYNATGQGDDTVTLGNSSHTNFYLAPGNTSGQTINFNDAGAGGFIQYDHGDDQMKLAVANTINVRIFDGSLQPGANDTQDLGSSSRRWDDVFATNGTIDTSDERRKDNVKDTSLGLDFVNKLKPKEYKWKDYDYEYIERQDGEEPKAITKTKTFKRKHQGLLAQDVEKTLKDIGLTNDDFAGIVYDEESDIYGLRYSQLIAPLIKAVQELSAKVEELEKK